MISNGINSCLSVVLLQAFCMGLVASAWVTRPSTSSRSTLAAPCRTFASATVPTTSAASSNRRLCAPLFMSEPAAVKATDSAEEEDDDDEYEIVEYDDLTEADFVGSEWRVGTLWRRNRKNPDRVFETWVRLAVDEEGKNVCFWGDNARGTWYFDTSAQYLSIAKTYLWGKQMWACVVDDYYYAEGSVRGWDLFQPARVQGLWQAIRLGVDEEERGIAPWWDPDRKDEYMDPRLEAVYDAAGPFMVDPEELARLKREIEKEKEVPQVPAVEEGTETTMAMPMQEVESARELAEAPVTEISMQEIENEVPQVPASEEGPETTMTIPMPEVESAQELTEAQVTEIAVQEESAEESIASTTMPTPGELKEDDATMDPTKAEEESAPEHMTAAAVEEEPTTADEATNEDERDTASALDETSGGGSELYGAPVAPDE